MRFDGGAGSCDGQSCEPGSSCFRGGADASVCSTPAPYALATSPPEPDPREFCQVANCGDIRCDPPLRCTDPSVGSCVR